RCASTRRSNSTRSAFLRLPLPAITSGCRPTRSSHVRRASANVSSRTGCFFIANPQRDACKSRAEAPFGSGTLEGLDETILLGVLTVLTVLRVLRVLGVLAGNGTSVAFQFLTRLGDIALRA